MKHFAGLDVSLKEVAICVVDEDGRVAFRATVPCAPRAIGAALAERGLRPDRIVHESGQISIWLQRELVRLGLPAVCIDARMAHKVLSARLNKSDRADAEGLAQLARTGWFTPVHVRSEDADRMRTLIGARDRLVRLRIDLEGHVRGVLKTFGIRMTGIGKSRDRQAFRDQLAAAGDADPVIRAVATGFIATHATLCAEASTLEKEIALIAKNHALARRLMTIPGIGPIVALSFVALVEDPDRFSRTSNVGAFLGLTPRRYQSGEMDYSGRVSKRGSAVLRRLLYEAASTVISRVKRFSPLKSWAVRLAARKGFKKAAVATARKLAVLMLVLWKNGTEFGRYKEAAT